MNSEGEIYEISESEKEQMIEKVREDTARLEGYLRGRSEEQTLQKLTPRQKKRLRKKTNKKKHERK